MEYIYPLITAFMIVFISELGDKTQILVLSFSSKAKAYIILLGVALGSLLSHGIAIIFGSILGSINNALFQNILKLTTYISFIIFGIITLYNNRKEHKSNVKKGNKVQYGLGVILIIAFTIAIGELGDKTFLASLGLGIQYYKFKVPLIIGAIIGMVLSDAIAIFLGKFINEKFPESIIQKFSGILFIIFGVFGFLSLVTLILNY